MNQLGLEFTAPRSHAYSDPATSHRAEQRCRESGAMGRQMRAVDFRVRLYPGRTAKQLTDIPPPLNGALSKKWDKRHSQIMRRLCDLKNAGRARRESVPGESEARWFHVER